MLFDYFVRPSVFSVIWSPHGGGAGDPQKACFYDQHEIGGEIGFLN